jgi:hypothetical protein
LARKAGELLSVETVVVLVRVQPDVVLLAHQSADAVASVVRSRSDMGSSPNTFPCRLPVCTVSGLTKFAPTNFAWERPQVQSLFEISIKVIMPFL